MILLSAFAICEHQNQCGMGGSKNELVSIEDVTTGVVHIFWIDIYLNDFSEATVVIHNVPHDINPKHKPFYSLFRNSFKTLKKEALHCSSTVVVIFYKSIFILFTAGPFTRALFQPHSQKIVHSHNQVC